MSDLPIVICVPAFNAARSLRPLLDRLAPHVGKSQILVVDDGSTDETAGILASAGIQFVRHERNRGKGAALRTGFERSKSLSGWEALVTMDADLQHRPEDLPRFVDRWEKDGPDVIVGSRVRGWAAMPASRVLSNTITSFLVSSRCGSSVPDSQCGFRLITRTVVETVHFDSDGYEAETEFLIRALLKGFSVQAVPIQTVYGDEQSHMTPWRTTQRFLSVLFRDY